MRIAVFYASKHGTTEKIAKQIVAGLSPQDGNAINIKKEHPDIESFDYIILGSSIYAGKIQPVMDAFCRNNLSALKEKVIGLFICGMETDEIKQKAELASAFLPELQENSVTKSFMGGEFIFEKMNIVERWLVKRIAKVSNSVSMINDYTVKRFISQLRSHLFLSDIEINDEATETKKSQTVETEDDDVAVEVYSGSMWDCGMVKSLLNDAGIEAFLNNENLGTVAPWIVAPGGAGAIGVIVARHNVKDASKIVDEFNQSTEDT